MSLPYQGSWNGEGRAQALLPSLTLSSKSPIGPGSGPMNPLTPVSRKRRLSSSISLTALFICSAGLLRGVFSLGCCTLCQKLISQNSLASPIVAFLGVTPQILGERFEMLLERLAEAASWSSFSLPHNWGRFLSLHSFGDRPQFASCIQAIQRELVVFFWPLFDRSRRRFVSLFVPLLPIANLVHPLPHGFLNAPQRFIFLDECLEVFVLPGVSRLLITLSDGASCIIAPLSLKALSNAAVHFFSWGRHLKESSAGAEKKVMGVLGLFLTSETLGKSQQPVSFILRLGTRPDPLPYPKLRPTSLLCWLYHSLSPTSSSVGLSDDWSLRNKEY